MERKKEEEIDAAADQVPNPVMKSSLGSSSISFFFNIEEPKGDRRLMVYERKRKG